MLKIHLQINDKKENIIFAKSFDWPCMIRQDECILLDDKYYQVGIIYHDIENNIIHAFAAPI